MKTLILFYSYSGHTEKIAKALAEKESAGMAQIESVKRPGRFRAYTAGCVAAMRGKAWPIRPLDVNFEEYSRLILLSPVWASSPPPAVHAFLEQLPEGKIIDVKMVSASGKSKCGERLEAVIKSKGGRLESFEDIKA